MFFRLQNHVPKACFTLSGCVGNLLHSGIANAPHRIVDDAADGLLVAGVADEAEIGDDVLDFLALIEAQAAVDAVGNVLSAHFLLEGAALGVCAVENGEIAIFALVISANSLDVVADDARLFLVGISLLQDDFLAFLVLAEHIFWNLPLIFFD